jgi:hypothetical protein
MNMDKENGASENPNEETNLGDVNHKVVKPTQYHVPPSNGVQTSNEAAKAIEPVAQRQRDILYRYVCDQYMLGTTNQEAEEALGMPAQTITPRMLELRKEGLVTDSKEKRQTRSGRRAIVWVDVRYEGYNAK